MESVHKNNDRFCAGYRRVACVPPLVRVGLFWGPGAKALNPLGTILTRLLTMVVAPLVLCLLVCAAADVGDGKKLGRMGVKTVVCFLLSTAIAIVLGLVTSNVIGVGTGVTIQQTAAQTASAAKEVSMLDTLINIIPTLMLGFALMKTCSGQVRRP